MLQSHGFSGARNYSARGRFFLYQSSNAAAIGADERIAVEVDGQPMGDFYVGDSIELPRGADSWRVVPYEPTLSGMVVIGDGTVRTNRVAGAVSIIDGANEKVRKGKTLYASFRRGAEVGFYPTVGTFNDNASADIAIHGITLYASQDGQVSLFVTTSRPVNGPATYGMRNKLLGAAPSSDVEYIAARSSTATPTIPTDFGGSISGIGGVQVAASVARSMRFDKSGPLILPAQRGLFVVHEVANTLLSIEIEAEQL